MSWLEMWLPPACDGGEGVVTGLFLDGEAAHGTLFAAMPGCPRTQLLSTTMGVKEYVQSEFGNVEAEIISKSKDLFPGTIIFDDFLWAFGILRSRVFIGLRGDKLALISLADLVRSRNTNHACIF
ncbi:hypothetical protein ABZP36_009490 [Zizania latifolia]